MAALTEEGGKGQGFVLVRLLWNGSDGGAGQPHLLFFRLGEGRGYDEELATRIEGEAGAGLAKGGAGRTGCRGWSCQSPPT